MAELTPLEKVPKDFDPNEVKGVFNPTKEDFTVPYGGIPVVLKAGEKKLWPHPKANHVAKHLARKIVNDKNKELLQEKFEGLDTEGREKWKVNTQILHNSKDVEDVKACLIFEPESVTDVRVEMPETKFDKAIETEKAVKKSKRTVKVNDEPVEEIELSAKKSKKSEE